MLESPNCAPIYEPVSIALEVTAGVAGRGVGAGVGVVVCASVGVGVEVMTTLDVLFAEGVDAAFAVAIDEVGVVVAVVGVEAGRYLAACA